MSDFTIIEAPDGTEIEFPPTMSEQDITAEMEKLFPAQAPVEAKPAMTVAERMKQGTTGQRIKNSFNRSIPETAALFASTLGAEGLAEKLDSFGKGAQHGASFGFKDEVVGAASALVPGGEGYREATDRVRAENAQAKEQAPITYFAGEITGAGATGGAGSVRAGAAGLGAKTQATIGGAVYGAGSDEGNVVERLDGTAKGAALGLGFGILGEKIGQKGIEVLTALKARKALVDPATGTLTQQAVRELESLGMTADDLTPDVQAQIVATFKDTKDLTQSARQVDANALPVPVQLTQGQRTADPNVLRLEDSAKTGLLGDKARDIATRADEVQQQGVNANAGAIRQAMGGDGVPVLPQEGGTAAAGRIGEKADAAFSAAKDLRNVAEEGQSFAPKAILGNFVGQTRQEMASLGYTAQTGSNEAVNGILKRAETLSKRATKGQLPTNVLMRLRQDIGDAAGSASGPERKLLGDMSRRMDAMVDDAIENALFTGDEEAVKAWGKSRKAFAEYYKQYEGIKGARKMIARMVSGEVEPEKVSNMLFSGQSARSSAKGLSFARELKKELGEASPEWQAIRQEAVTRLFKDGGEAGNVTTSFSRELETALTQDGAMMREMFTPDEIVNLRRLSRVQRYMTNRTLNRSNPSKSGEFMTFFARRFGGPAADIVANLPGVQPIVRALAEGQNARKIEHSVNPAN